MKFPNAEQLIKDKIHNLEAELRMWKNEAEKYPENDYEETIFKVRMELRNYRKEGRRISEVNVKAKEALTELEDMRRAGRYRCEDRRDDQDLKTILRRTIKLL